MDLFKCKHPARYLAVQKPETREPSDDPDMEVVTYYLLCQNCREHVSIKHAAFIGGVDVFFARKERAEQKAGLK